MSEKLACAIGQLFCIHYQQNNATFPNAIALDKRGVNINNE